MILNLELVINFNMKLIAPSVQFIPQDYSEEGIYKHIEKCARTCYKSEDKITKDSAEAFVERMIKSKHYSMLEHGTVLLKIPKDHVLAEYFLSNKYSMVFPTNNMWEITTNLRCIPNYSLKPLLHQLTDKTFYDRLTFKFICSRSTAQQLTRHRAFSFAMESQRYCNYSKDKFGNQITFIAPEVAEEGDKINAMKIGSTIYSALKDAENNYLELIKLGCTPEEARSVLPNATKTELIMTGSVYDWRCFIKQRCEEGTGKVEKEMKELATTVKDSIAEHYQENL